MEGGSAAWLALIPLLLVLLRCRSVREGCCVGLVTGGLYYGISLVWLLALRHTWGQLPLTVAAWLGLALYCSLYVGLFGACVVCIAQWLRPKGRVGALLLLVLIPVLWVGTEWLRAVLFTGFPWNPLGSSQYANPVLLQPARIFGVYGVSFLIVLFNASLALTIERVYGEIRGRGTRSRVHLELMVGLLVVALSWSYGMRTLLRLRNLGGEGEVLRVALIQPAIPQVQKWSEEHAREIEQVLAEQSDMALVSQPDLVVWPETATPGFLRFDHVSRSLAERVTGAGAALLAGTMDADPGGRHYYNASLLLLPEAGITATYRKRHLVPFGEYVPLTRWVPVLEQLAPLGFSCVPGAHDQPLVTLPHAAGSASVSVGILICFEDVFPYLSRTDVKRGARLLVNQTNDGWFDGTAASRQHLANAVLRSVENGVPMIRAANTGISAFIEASGRFHEAPGPAAAGARGLSVRGVRLPPDDFSLGLYTRYGDWLLAIPCAIYTLIIVSVLAVSAGKRSRITHRDRPKRRGRKA